MPEFPTPQPITVTVEVFLGSVQVEASDRTDTVVEVRPADPAKRNDVRAAEETRVEFAAGQLTVQGPSGWRMYAPPNAWRNPSIDVRIKVPAGSRLHGTGHVCPFLVTGELGQCELRTSVGALQVEAAGPLELRTAGNITVGQALAAATITTSTGIIAVGEISGSAVIRNSNGDSTIRDVTGDLKVNAANGNITVERPRGSVTARTANGNIRIGDASRGTVRLETSAGQLEVGIHPGSAAYLDASTKSGSLQNLMEAAGQPGPGEDTVRVHARTSFGDIIIRPATAA
jgi:hypothetical protein